MAFYSSVKQFVGIAKEVTPGTGVAMTATLPVTKFDPEDKPVWLDDKGWRGSMVDMYGRQQGVIKSDFSMSGDVFVDGIGYLLANIMGDLTVTGTTAPFSNAFSTLNSAQGQPVTNTLTHFQGATATSGARQYPGACLSELNLKFNAESQLLTFDAKGSSWPSVPAGATPTPAPSVVAPVASWRAILGIGGPATGGTLIKYVSDGEVNIKRALDVVYTAQNVQSPFAIVRGAISVSGKLNFVTVPDEGQLLHMLNNDQPQLQLIVSNGLSGASSGVVQVDIKTGAYKTAKIDTAKAAVGFQVGFDAIANTTNAGASLGYSPALVTVTNAVTTGTYQ